ncbi:MAG: hypothetical protein IT427_20815 [Pirellulales bacterium]|nr:hypothetical protein [Pirellulales bacterium]
MPHRIPLGEVLSKPDQLTADEQETVVAILHRRLTAKGRRRVVAEVRGEREKFAAGRFNSATVDKILCEARP